jgi:hypothetical protein
VHEHLDGSKIVNTRCLDSNRIEFLQFWFLFYPLLLQKDEQLIRGLVSEVLLLLLAEDDINMRVPTLHVRFRDTSDCS